MTLTGADGLDGSVNGMTSDIKNVGSAGGRYSQQYLQGGGVYNSTTQEFGTERFYSSGRHNGSLYGANTMYQKSGNVNAVDTWRTNKTYLDKVRKTVRHANVCNVNTGLS